MAQLQLAGFHVRCQKENPITVELCVKEKPEKITVMYLYNDWWTRPAFINGFSQIPARTQIVFLKSPDRYACLVPAVGESFKAYLAAAGWPGFP